MPFTPLRPEQGLAALERDTAAFAAVLRTGDLAAPVPGCPGWSLLDLGYHLAGIYVWANGAIVEGHPNTTFEAGPADRESVLAAYTRAADLILGTLRGTDPGTPCWGFGPKPRQAEFWFRRQAHETAMHAGDAARSQGHPAGYPADLVADGVDEVVRMFFPRQVRAGRIPALERSLALELDGVDAGWLLAGDGTGPGPDTVPDATLSGDAEAVLLALWHRIDLADPRLRVDGDPAAARAVLAAQVTP